MSDEGKSVPKSQALRQEVIRQRRGLESREKNVLSRQVAEHFFSKIPAHFDWKGKQVALYQALFDELDLTYCAEVLFKKGAHLSFPGLRTRDGLEFISVLSLDPSQFEVGRFGIAEPISSNPHIPPDNLDIIFVPGVVFGLSGQRIGRGLGYYDRYLTKTRAIRIALCFDIQFKDDVPQENRDQPMEWILSERREWLSPRARGYFLENR